MGKNGLCYWPVSQTPFSLLVNYQNTCPRDTKQAKQTIHKHGGAIRTKHSHSLAMRLGEASCNNSHGYRLHVPVDSRRGLSSWMAVWPSFLRLKLSTDDDARLARLPVLRAGGIKMASLSLHGQCAAVLFFTTCGRSGECGFGWPTSYPTQTFDKWPPVT
jgi:hypothetical protein